MHGGIQNKATVHKDEKPGRLKSDSADRENLRAELERYIDPFDTKSNTAETVNISSGAANKDPLVNVENSVSFGCQTRQLIKDKKAVRIGDLVACNTKAIYARIMCLIICRQINIEKVHIFFL